MFKSRWLLFYFYPHPSSMPHEWPKDQWMCENTDVDYNSQLKPCSLCICCVSPENSEAADGILIFPQGKSTPEA